MARLTGRRLLRIVLVTFFLGISLVNEAWAHSHIFVDARTGSASTEEGQLRALKITWTYDAFTMVYLLDVHNLDKNGDNSLDIADRKAIAIAETADWPPS